MPKIVIARCLLMLKCQDLSKRIFGLLRQEFLLDEGEKGLLLRGRWFVEHCSHHEDDDDVDRMKMNDKLRVQITTTQGWIMMSVLGTSTVLSVTNANRSRTENYPFQDFVSRFTMTQSTIPPPSSMLIIVQWTLVDHATSTLAFTSQPLKWRIGFRWFYEQILNHSNRPPPLSTFIIEQWTLL